MKEILRENERIDIIPGSNLKIIQDEKRFCYGIDAILLSKFVKIKKGNHVMDLGTGTGIIPLRLYSLSNSEKIIGIEIQKEVAEMANRTIKLNGLEDRIEIINMDLKDIPLNFQRATFDVITSNPPYMKNGTGIINPDESLSISRHEIKCTLEDIVKVAKYLLKDKGRLYLVHRPNRLVDIIWTTRKHGLEPKTLRFVHPKIGKKPNLLLLECIKGGNAELKIGKPLIVYNDNGGYTEEIYKIYGIYKENKNE
jgi:tRNA1Val (adenine37-N6)-methyltransferase